MSYRQLVKNAKGANDAPNAAKMPKCAAVAFWWFIVLGAVNLISCLWFSPYDSQPWTEYADHGSMAVGMLFCAFAIAMRNARAVLLAVVALFSILVTHSVAATLAILPIGMLLLPQCVRWMELHVRLPIVMTVVAIILVLFNVLMYFMPCVSETYISNKNPLWIVSPGWFPVHQLNKINQHEYDYWQHGCRMGKCVAQYNEKNECCIVKLDVLSGGVKTKEEYGEFFLKNMKDLCDQRFADLISWSDMVSDQGWPILYGSFDLEEDKVIIEICPNEDPYVYGTMLVYKPKLIERVEPSSSNDNRKPGKGRKDSAYGKNIPDEYGANKNLFYANPYKQDSCGMGIPDSYGTNRNVYANPYKHINE